MGFDQPEPAARPVADGASDALRQRFHAVRRRTLALCDGLTAEDCQAQSMADASPAKWHLAHTTWFFDRLVLAECDQAWQPPAFAALFNSYYQSLGAPYPREARGLLTRPSLAEVMAWREAVDEAIDALLPNFAPGAAALGRIELGLHHEQQHQELILTDVKHLLWCNPLKPALRPRPTPARFEAPRLRWLPLPAQRAAIGHHGEGFAFDNEQPRHVVEISGAALASRLVTNGEFREFVDAGGYRDPLLWLADGWLAVQAGGWNRPLYWGEDLDSEFTLHGEQPIERDAPVCHLSYYEADAYARWAGARLPREEEWECLARQRPVEGAFLESGDLHPRPGDEGFYGSVWQWTASPYLPYPGYQPLAGTLGEYNGKFMCNQLVLRGGSCVSPASHLRATYRNFFPPQARWQFSGLRLARELR